MITLGSLENETNTTGWFCFSESSGKTPMITVNLAFKFSWKRSWYQFLCSTGNSQIFFKNTKYFLSAYHSGRFAASGFCLCYVLTLLRKAPTVLHIWIKNKQKISSQGLSGRHNKYFSAHPTSENQRQVMTDF